MQAKQQRPRVVMIGPAIDGKGGMAEAVRNLLRTELARRYGICYLATIVSGNVIKKIFVALVQLVRFVYICLVDSPSLVHIHFCSGISVYRKSLFILVARLFKIPILLHAHGGRFIQFYERCNRLLKKYISKILNLSSCLILLSSEKLSWFSRLLNHDTIFTIPNLIALPDWVSKRDLPRSKQSVSILYLGSIIKEKGVFDLIESVPSIISEHPNTQFIIVGSGKLEQVRQLSEAKKIQNNVVFTGWVDESAKLKLLNQADILILPSYYEELPYSILEGMAAGLAIAASRVGGIPTLIEAGANGLLFEPGNISEIVDTLKFLISYPEVRIQMGKTNIQKIKAEFSTEKIVPQMMSVYSQLIQNASPR